MKNVGGFFAVVVLTGKVKSVRTSYLHTGRINGNAFILAVVTEHVTTVGGLLSLSYMLD